MRLICFFCFVLLSFVRNPFAGRIKVRKFMRNLKASREKNRQTYIQLLLGSSIAVQCTQTRTNRAKLKWLSNWNRHEVNSLLNRMKQITDRGWTHYDNRLDGTQETHFFFVFVWIVQFFISLCCCWFSRYYSNFHIIILAIVS